MKIVHLCLTGVVTDGFTYQDNMLSKYHKKLGYDVTIITSKWIFSNTGEIVRSDKTSYFNDDGVFMVRLDNFFANSHKSKIKLYHGISTALKKERPDIIFIHGVQFLQMFAVVRFLKKNPDVKVYVDNHADFSNSGRTFLSKNILQKGLWRHSAQEILPYVEKFYGVLPARVDWLVEMYGLPKEKCELLVMGADDDAVKRAFEPERISRLRSKFNISEDDFVIVTGGKIDSFKLQTLLLMEAVKRIENGKLKLLVFGSVQKDIQERLHSLCDGNKIQYIGWAKGEESYGYFALANLVVFPGRHSVYWEQVAGMGIPMACKFWDGTNHVDLGGNVTFLYKDCVDEIQSVIEGMLNCQQQYKKMIEIAQGSAKKQFSYLDIAKRSIE